MAPETLLFFGILLLVLGLLVVGYALGGGATGVAQSLALIDRQVSEREVARNELSAKDRLFLPLLDSARKIGFRLSPRGTTDRLGHLLDLAGNPQSWTVDRVLGAKGVGLVVGPLIGVLLLGFTPTGLLAAAAAGVACFFLPDLLIYNLGLKRQEELQRSLADALDMLTVCVEAGQGFDAALMQVARSVTGPVSGEFTRVISEIQIGKSRAEAFTGLANRTKVTEIKTFVSALVQADRLGLPVANVLREQSKEMRLARRQLAEEKAMKIPVKILFPMLLGIFPALFIVIIGPGAISIINAFSSM